LATAHATGRTGENIAYRHLIRDGFDILERNWRLGKAEIDIIAKDEDALVFVEVKTRSTDAFGAPESFLSPRQAQLIAAAAAAYMEQIGHDWELRFDVISIILDEDGSYRLQHLRDAFFPGFDD
jgi:putative endonuclease